MELVVRPARTSDIKKIRSIVDLYATQRRLLSKETVTLYEGVQEFTVAEVNGEVVGCGALHVLWEDLAEVRTVAVIESMQGKGIGHAILESNLRWVAYKSTIDLIFLISEVRAGLTTNSITHPQRLA